MIRWWRRRESNPVNQSSVSQRELEGICCKLLRSFTSRLLPRTTPSGVVLGNLTCLCPKYALMLAVLVLGSACSNVAHVRKPRNYVESFETPAQLEERRLADEQRAAETRAIGEAQARARNPRPLEYTSPTHTVLKIVGVAVAAHVLRVHVERRVAREVAQEIQRSE